MKVKIPEPNFVTDDKVKKWLVNCPLFLTEEDELEVLCFRRILEHSLSQGRWAGEMSLPS